MTTAFVFPGLNGAGHTSEHLPLLRRPGFVRRWQSVTRACGHSAGFAEFAVRLHAGSDLPLLPATWPWRALAVAAMQLAMAEELEARGEHADWLCGYSVGDVARSCHAGAFTFDDVVAFAAALPALPAADGTTAIVHTTCAVQAAELRERIERLGVQCSTLSPRFLMLAGERAAVVRALHAAEAPGVHAREIAACPLHTSLQRPLAAQLARALAGHRFAPLHRAVFSTSWSRPIGPADDLRTELVANPTSRCDFAGTIRRLHEEHGVTRFVDLGPGRHAQRFVRHHGGALAALGAGDLLAVRALRA